MTDSTAAIAEALGEESSPPGFRTLGSPQGSLTVAYVLFRGIVIEADAAGEAEALAALHAKVVRYRDRILTLPEIEGVSDINLLRHESMEGPGTRCFVRRMSPERALFEHELGIGGAFMFLDEATGVFAMITRMPNGLPQLVRVGPAVLGDDAEIARPLPVPGRTPLSEEEARRRAEKQERVRALLRCPACHEELVDHAAGLRCSRCDRDFPAFEGKPVLPLDEGYDPSPRGMPESQNTYGPQVLALIEENRDGWVLDCGSGNPTRGFYNVVHLELFGYDEVDVVTDGAALPFADDTFDAVLSEAVLEHVRDPDAYVREIRRVMKPGAKARFDAAFLQPYHGYPDHYFNMTRAGLQLVMERGGFEVVDLRAGEHQYPFVALGVLLQKYVDGTVDEEKRARMRELTISDALGILGRGGTDPFDGLSPEATDILAAGFGCLARKPRD